MQLVLARQTGPIDLCGVVLLHAVALAALLIARSTPAPVGATAPIMARLIEAPATVVAPAAPARPKTAEPLAMRTPPRPPKPEPVKQPPPRPTVVKPAKPVIATTAAAATREVAVAPAPARPKPPRKPEPARPVTEPPPPAALARVEPAAPSSQPPAPASTAAAAPAAASRATAPTESSRRTAGSTGSPSDNRAYFASLLQRLNRFKVYPTALRKEKVEGRVVLRFTIDARGGVIAASIEDSSGHAALDRAAEEMLARAAPLPAIPASMGKSSLTLSVPVEYSLLTER
jgi:protein TonB